MKKIKKLGLIAATTATITSPLPFLVSCGFFTSDKPKEQGIKVSEPKQPVYKKPNSIPGTKLIPAQIVKPIVVDTKTNDQTPKVVVPYIKLTPSVKGLELIPGTDVDETTNIKHVAGTDLNDTVPSLQGYALKDPISVPGTKLKEPTIVRGTSLNSPTGKTIPGTDLNPSKDVIKGTALNHSMIVIPGTDVDENTNIMTIPGTKIDLTTNKTIIPGSEIDLTTNHFKPIPGTALNQPKSVPGTELNLPTRMPLVALNPSKVTIPGTKLSPSKVTVLGKEVDPNTNIKPVTSLTNVNPNTNIKHVAGTDIDATTNVKHTAGTDIDLTTNVKPVVNTPQPVVTSTPGTDVDETTNVKHTAGTDVNTTTNVKHTAGTDINTTTNVKHTAGTDIDATTNVKHTAGTDIDATTNVKHTAGTDIDLTTNVKPVVNTPQPVVTSTPGTDVDETTNVKHTAGTDINITTNVKHTAGTDVNTTTNVKHTAGTDINTTTNVKHTAGTDIDLTTNVKPVAATSNAQSLYVGKTMPVSGSTPIASQYKANYAGADLFGQQLNMGYNRAFNKADLKGLYVGYSNIKPDPNEFYTKGEEGFADVDAIVAEMNKESDISGHAIGEPYVDALNAVRYTIKKSAQGDSHLVPHLRNIVEKMGGDRGLKAKTTVRGTDFTSNATVDINDGLLGKTQIPVIPSDNYAPSGGNPNDNYLNPRHIRVASDLATMKAIRFSEDLQKGSQYRAQQNEGRGTFDDHEPVRTNAEMGQHAGNAKGNLMNPNTKAPVVQSVPVYGAGENYVNFGGLDQTNLPYAAKGHKASEMNIYRGISHVLSTLFDETDYTKTGGHRYPMFDPQNDLIGYSITFEALSGTGIGSNSHFAAAVPYIVTEMGNTQKSGAPTGRISTYVQDGYDDKFSTVLPYDLLGSGSLSIYYDGAERQATIDRLFTQK